MRIRVKNAYYNVVITSSIDDDCDGICESATRTIFIKRGLSERRTIVVFFHELLHAFENEYGIRIGHAMIEKLEGPLANFFMADENKSI